MVHRKVIFQYSQQAWILSTMKFWLQSEHEMILKDKAKACKDWGNIGDSRKHNRLEITFTSIWCVAFGWPKNIWSLYLNSSEARRHDCHYNGKANTKGKKTSCALAGVHTPYYQYKTRSTKKRSLEAHDRVATHGLSCISTIDNQHQPTLSHFLST